MSMLTVENLNVYYGMIHALKGLSFHVEEGEIVALIGANGAGKTTTLQTISGILQAKSGSVNFQGKEITSVSGNQIVKLGMSHVPEGRRMFSNLTVYENLMMGAYTRKDKKQIAETLEKVYERFPRLQERTRQLAGTLSGGEQQMLAMGRALMAQPRIILMPFSMTNPSKKPTWVNSKSDQRGILYGENNYYHCPPIWQRRTYCGKNAGRTPADPIL